VSEYPKIGYVSLGPEGDIFVNDGNDDQGNLLATLPASVQVGLDLFNDGRESFSWHQDSQRLATLVTWILENNGWYVEDPLYFERRMQILCEPGGPQPENGFVFKYNVC
jgi:hypothetical protein